ncbi:MAG: tetratricopeptide (TPR) repeat protein [Maribacter sp.]|jgi:tetratricopeptide (TPR) repeat protein
MSDRLELLKSMLEKSPKDSFLLFAIAKEYEGLGENKAALDFFLNLKESQPDYVGLYYHLGKLYEKNDEIETAFFTYKDGMEVAKAAGDQHALSELAGAKLFLGDDDDFE